MAASDDLLEFVRDALGRGLPRAQIVEVLERAGWTSEQTRAALASYADIEFPIPKSKGRLPETVDDISRESGAGSRAPSDPVTGAAYMYRVVDRNSYEVCAAFDRASRGQFTGDVWAHGAGWHCFTKKADAAN